MFNPGIEWRDSSRAQGFVFKKATLGSVFSDDGKMISGRWEFKAGIAFVGLMLLLGKSNGGTWTMRLIKPDDDSLN